MFAVESTERRRKCFHISHVFLLHSPDIWNEYRGRFCFHKVKQYSEGITPTVPKLRAIAVKLLTSNWQPGHWETDVHHLPLSQTQLLLSLYLYHPICHPLYGNLCWACHIRYWVWLLIWLVRLATMLQWCGQTGWYKRQSETAGVQGRVGERRPISWEEYWSDHLFLPSPCSSSVFSEEDGEWQREGKRTEVEREWMRRRDRDGHRGWWRHNAILSVRPTIQCYIAMAQGTD